MLLMRVTSFAQQDISARLLHQIQLRHSVPKVTIVRKEHQLRDCASLVNSNHQLANRLASLAQQGHIVMVLILQLL